MPRTLHIRVIPRSSTNEMVGELADGIVKIKITAPPVDGKANDAVIRLLSEVWDIQKSKIRIIKGATSRNM